MVAFRTVADSTVTEPKRIGKYDVTGTLGEGSFGVVYQGFDPFIKRRLAIKICTVEDHDLRRRFYREAEIAGRLQHKNIVTVFAFGTDGDRPYLVQELLDGEDLDKVIRRRDSLEHSHRLQILFQVARALDYAHRNGVVHRDVKPGNVRLLADGRVKLMDFGIAKLAGAQTQLTREGVTLGTASYLPPEQVRAEPLDHRADIFSFGVLAYELMAYERPFRGNTLSALVYQILYKVPVPLGTVWQACPSVLSDLVARCMAKKPEDRWGDFGELLVEMEKAREAMTSAAAAGAGGSDAAAKLDDTRPVTVADEGTEAIGVTDQIAALVVENTQDGGEGIDLDAPTMMATGLDAVAEPGSEPLKQRAAEIGSLIEKGELQSAMRQLEDTVQEHLDGTRDEVFPEPSATGTAATASAASVAPRAAMPSEADTQPTQAQVDETRPTSVIEMDASDATRPVPQAPDEPPQPATVSALDPSEVPTRIMAIPPEEGSDDAEEDDTRAAQVRPAAPPPVPPRPTASKPTTPSPTTSKPASATPVGPKPVTEKPPVAPSAAPSKAKSPVPRIPGAKPAPAKPKPKAASSAKAPSPKPAASKAPSPKAPPSKEQAPKPPAAKAPRRASEAPAAGKRRLPLVAAAAAVVGILFVIWLLRGRAAPPEPTVAETTQAAPLPAPPPPADAGTATPQGFARLAASPWAEVLEIADRSGTRLPLPDQPFTPLLLPLAPGTYRIALGYPGLEEPAVCELVIEVGSVVECAPEVAAIRPTDYFKAVGWWR